MKHFAALRVLRPPDGNTCTAPRSGIRLSRVGRRRSMVWAGILIILLIAPIAILCAISSANAQRWAFRDDTMQASFTTFLLILQERRSQNCNMESFRRSLLPLIVGWMWWPTPRFFISPGTP